MSHVLDLDPYFGLSDLPVTWLVLVQYLGADTCFPGPYWGKKEHTTSMHVPLMTGTKVSQNSEIPAYVGNLVSYAQVDGNGSMSSALSG